MVDTKNIRELVSKIDIEKADEEKILLINIIEMLLQTVEVQAKKLEALESEIKELKGGNGKPGIKGKSDGAKNSNKGIKDSNKPKPIGWKKSSKNDGLKIDHEIQLPIDKSKLPSDAVYKGSREKIVQGLVFARNNVKLIIQRYYSESENKYYESEIPTNYEDQFSKELQAFIIMSSVEGNMGHDKIIRLLETIGIKISAGQVEAILNKKNQDFHEEMEQAFMTAIDLVGFMHSDDTGARHEGSNWFTSVFCNFLCTMFKTTPKKNRLTVIQNLVGKDKVKFLINKGAIQYMKDYKVGKIYSELLQTLIDQEFNTEEELEQVIKIKYPKIPEQKLTQIKIGAAYASIKKQGIILIDALMTDAAGQFRSLALIHALCWVHEIRHYTDLNPNVLGFKKMLEDFTDKVQAFYARLKLYKENPNKEQMKIIQEEFENLFSTVTKYNDLNKVIAQTKKRQEGLLVVLENPDLPLHNNHAEQQIRPYVIKRKIQFGTRSEDGRKSRDTFMSISMTCRKLDLSFFKFLIDRKTNARKILPLAEMMKLKMVA
jgi:hypothetical protein